MSYSSPGIFNALDDWGGRDPQAGFTDVSGTLYGTTRYGGANDLGTVFSITPSGTETVLYSFKGGLGDGEYPSTVLLDVDGTLYGTTQTEGGSGCHGGGCGVVFKVTTSGAESVLYSFKGSPDGAYPLAGLIDVKGTLYGTTDEGGDADNDGTIFKVTTSGKESVLYSFKGSPDCGGSGASLLDVNGTLYGTSGGGANNSGCVFRISP